MCPLQAAHAAPLPQVMDVAGGLPASAQQHVVGGPEANREDAVVVPPHPQAGVRVPSLLQLMHKLLLLRVVHPHHPVAASSAEHVRVRTVLHTQNLVPGLRHAALEAVAADLPVHKFELPMLNFLIGGGDSQSKRPVDAFSILAGGPDAHVGSRKLVLWLGLLHCVKLVDEVQAAVVFFHVERQHLPIVTGDEQHRPVRGPSDGEDGLARVQSTGDGRHLHLPLDLEGELPHAPPGHRPYGINLFGASQGPLHGIIGRHGRVRD
mmetsp:Transcript_151684/g.265045  ORF Transcript_151684/g.265045 Transcript_151684/m.265045 type:complete len:264 (+) Transcript_151684:1723-2514(+)